MGWGRRFSHLQTHTGSREYGNRLTGGYSGDEVKLWKVCPQVASRERGAKGREPSSRCQGSSFDDSEAPRSPAMGRGRIFDYDLLNADRSRLYEVILDLCRAASICQPFPPRIHSRI